MSSLSAVEAKLEAESKAFQALQKELEKLVETRQRLEAQQQENEIVNTEFGYLEDDASLFKLVGPVLVKQEKAEAVSNVKNRLNLISSEIKRVETQLTELTAKTETKKQEITQLQLRYQQLTAAK